MGTDVIAVNAIDAQARAFTWLICCEAFTKTRFGQGSVAGEARTLAQRVWMPLTLSLGDMAAAAPGQMSRRRANRCVSATTHVSSTPTCLSCSCCSRKALRSVASSEHVARGPRGFNHGRQSYRKGENCSRRDVLEQCADVERSLTVILRRVVSARISDFPSHTGSRQPEVFLEMYADFHQNLQAPLIERMAVVLCKLPSSCCWPKRRKGVGGLSSQMLDAAVGPLDAVIISNRPHC